MIDPVAAAMNAIALRSPAAAGLIFVAGAVTSVGPCVAPRYVTIAVMARGDRRPLVPTVAFLAGLIVAFGLLGYVAGLLGTLWMWSTPMYVVLGAGLFVGGCISLVRAVPHDAACAATSRPRNESRSLGACFLLGVGNACIVSPCCTPIVAAALATSTAIGDPRTGMLLLSSFAAGHALPLLFAGSLAGCAKRQITRRLNAQVPAIVGAVLMLALGLYYGMLA